MVDADGTSGDWAAPDGSQQGQLAPPHVASATSVATPVGPPPAFTPLDPGIAPGAVSYAMYKPGIIVLRPLGFGEILDGAIHPQGEGDGPACPTVM